MRKEDPEWLVERHLIGEDAKRGRFPIHIRIGRPYAESEDWRCPVAIEGIWARLPDMAGVDSFQALFLALSMTRQALEDFVEKGGILRWPGEEDPVSLESAFGKMRI